MINAFRAVWVRLRSRTLLLVTLGGSALFALIPTAIVVGTASGPGGVAGAPPRPGGGVSVAELEQADGPVQALASSVSLLGLLALSLFAFVAASEFSTGSIRNLLVRASSRTRLFVGSYLGLVSLIAVGAVIAAGTAFVTSLVVASSAGIDTTAWLTGHGAAETLAGTANLALAMSGFGTIGYALGTLLRSPAAAIGVGAAWLLPFEAILAASVDGADRWLPGRLLSALVSGGTDTLAYGYALAVAAAMAGAMWATALARLRTGDVMS